MEDKVVLLDFWASPYAVRVRLALAEKGIRYEKQEENFADKSPLLLEMNPVHKKIPVLIHNGKPICESLLILQCIDEVWHDRSPLLPSDPYQRSQARFWADFIDKKVYDNGSELWRETGEKQKELRRGFIEGLKMLEGELGERPYFGGDTIGYVDVALLRTASWFYSFEVCAKFSVEDECPKITGWVNRCMQKETVSQSLPDHLKTYDYVLMLKQKYGLD